MELPSKELLSEVLEDSIVGCNIKDNTIIVRGDICEYEFCPWSEPYNIYELTHKCKK